jgi:hypothetical protein
MKNAKSAENALLRRLEEANKKLEKYTVSQHKQKKPLAKRCLSVGDWSVYDSVPKRRIFRAIAAILALLMAEQAHAEMYFVGPLATPLDMVCKCSEIFIAEVLSAKSLDCRLQYPDALECEPQDILQLSVKIGRIIAADGQDVFKKYGHVPRSGDTIDVGIKIYNRLPQVVGGVKLDFRNDKMGMLSAEPRTGKPLSVEDIANQFVGKTFVFGIKLDDWVKRDDVWAHAWLLTLQPWIEDTLNTTTGRPCPRPIQDDDLNNRP